MKEEKKEHALKFAKHVVKEIFDGALTINEYRIDLWYDHFLTREKWEEKHDKKA